MTTDAAISPLELKQHLAAFPPPALIDVRRAPAFDADPNVIPGAVRIAPDAVDAAARTLEPWRTVITYCVHGHEVSQDAAALLRARSFDARFVEGGLDGWRVAGFATTPWRKPTRWVTREHPKIDRIACPWLVRRFIDPAAEVFYVPAASVRAFAAANDARAFDIPDATYGHAGAECSFDAFIRLHELGHPALAQLAMIVRGADTSALDVAPQASGLLAVSRGLSALFADDQTMLKWGMLVYDSLYAWCCATQGVSAQGVPGMLRTSAAA